VHDASVKYDRPIHELLRDAARELREPFAAKDVLDWFAARYPDVAPSAVRAHIQAMTGNVPNREQNHPHLGARPPVLRRLERGRYARWTGSTLGDASVATIDATPPTAAPARPAAAAAAAAAEDEWFWEGHVQAKLLAHLIAQGWAVVRVADTRTREGGTDVIARRNGRLLHVEVKGWPSAVYRDPAKSHLKKPTLPATQARVWFNDAVVHGLRLRDANPGDDVALCFPDKHTYRALCRGVAGSLLRCGVTVLLLDEQGRCTSAGS
jgi:Holliday junction resolvase-like predicted endonuclease